MSKNRDDFTAQVKNILNQRASFICSNPDCRAMTLAPSLEDECKFIYIGKIAHITAAAKGGPRYDENMTSEERRSYNNGIFLCSSCADMIDKNNGIDFSINLLKEWKERHNKWVINNLNKKKRETYPMQINVTSIGQQGGITTGVCNIGTIPRKLTDTLLSELLAKLPDGIKINITCILGDTESLAFATEIKKELLELNYKVEGIKQSVFAEPLKGIIFNLKTSTLIVAANG